MYVNDIFILINPLYSDQLMDFLKLTYNFDT